MPARVPSFVVALIACVVVAVAASLGTVVGPAGAQETVPPTSTTPTTPTTPVGPSAPTSDTGLPEAISSSSVTLAGSVNPGGGATTYSFELGTTTAYGVSSASQTLAAGVGTTTIRIPVSGLTAATTYHYRLVATSAAGTARGTDRTFRTLAAPSRPSVASAAATAITSQSASLPARISPRGQATSVVVEIGPTKSFGSQTEPIVVGPAGASLPVALIAGALQPNTRYYFRAVAKNATGTTKGRTRTFTTLRDVSGVSIKAARSTVTWGSGTVVAGAVSGAGIDRVQVELLRQDAPYDKAPSKLAATTTGAGGTYTFSVSRLRASTRLSVRTRSTPAQTSRAIQIRSRLLVQFTARKRTSRAVQVRALVDPRIGSGKVYLQRRTASRWVTVKRPRLTHSRPANRSSATATIARRAKTERYRVVVSPGDAGAHVQTTSSTLTVPRR